MKNRKLLFFFVMVLSIVFLLTNCDDSKIPSSSQPSNSTTSLSNSTSTVSSSSTIPDDPNPTKRLYVIGAAANGWSYFTPLTLRIDGVFYGQFDLKTTAEGFVVTDQENYDGLVFKSALNSNFTVSKYGTYMIYFTYDVTKTDLTWKEATEKNSAKVGYYKIDLISAVEIPIDDELVFISGSATDFTWGNYGPIFYNKDKGYYSKIYRLTTNAEGFIITSVEDTLHLVFHNELGNNFKVTVSGDYEIRFTYDDMSGDPTWKVAKEIKEGKDGYYQLIPQFELPPETGNYLYVFGKATGDWGTPIRMVETQTGIWSITLDINTSTEGFVINEKPSLSDKSGATLHDEKGANFIVYEIGNYTLSVTWNDMSTVEGWKVAVEMNSNAKGNAWYKLVPNFEIIVDDFSVLYVVGTAAKGWDTYLPFYPDENGIYSITLDLTNSTEGFIISSRKTLSGYRFKTSDKKNIVVPKSGSYTLQFALEDQGYGWLKSTEELNRTPTTCYKITANFENSGLPTFVDNYTIFYNLYIPSNTYHLMVTLKDIDLNNIKTATVKMTYLTTGVVKTPSFNSNDFKFTYLDTLKQKGTAIEFNPNVGKVMSQVDMTFEGTITLNDDTVLTYYFGYFFGNLASLYDLYSSQLTYNKVNYNQTQITAIDAYKVQCLDNMKAIDANYAVIVKAFKDFVATQVTLQQVATFKAQLEAKYNPTNYNEESLLTIRNKVNDLVSRYDGLNAKTLEDEFNSFLSTILTPAQILSFMNELNAMVERDEYNLEALDLIDNKVQALVALYDGSNALELKNQFNEYLKQFVTQSRVEALKTTLKAAYLPSKYELAEQNAILNKIDLLVATFDGYNEENIKTAFDSYISTVKDSKAKHLDRFGALDIDGANPTGLNNVALQGSVWTSSTSYNSGKPSDIIDGKTDVTFQDSNTSPQDNLIVRIDLGSVKSVKAARIYWGSVNNFADSFYVQISLDGINWQTIYTVNGQTLYAENLFNKICLEENVNARYIQFVGVKRAKTYGYGFKEFQVYGNDVVLPSLSTVSGLTYNVDENNGTKLTITYSGNANEALTPAWKAVSFTANIYYGTTLVKTISGITNPSNTTSGSINFDVIGLALGNYTLKLVAIGDYVLNSSSVESEGVTITITELAPLQKVSNVEIEDYKIYFANNNATIDGVMYNVTFTNGSNIITINNIVSGTKIDINQLVDKTTYKVKIAALCPGYAVTYSEESDYLYQAPSNPTVVMLGERVYLYAYVYKTGESRFVLKFTDNYLGAYRTYGDNGGFQVDFTKSKLYINDVEIPVTLWQKSYGVYFKTDASILGNLATFNNAEFKVQMYDLSGKPFYCQFETKSATTDTVVFADSLMTERMTAVSTIIANTYSSTITAYQYAQYSSDDNATITPIIKKFLDDLFDQSLTNTSAKINSLKTSVLSQIAIYTKLTEVRPTTVTQASTATGKDNLVDSSTTTTWTGNKADVASGKPYYIVDLGNTYDLQRVLVYLNTSASVPTSYVVYTSLDGIDYTQATEGVWYANTAGYINAEFTTTCRYVKVEFTLASTVTKVIVHETYFFK